MAKRNLENKIIITVIMSLAWIFWMTFIIIYKLELCHIVHEKSDLLYYIGIGLTILEPIIVYIYLYTDY
jgi:hypothetical protein